MEKFLLDTHIILWMASNPSKLTEKVKQVLVSNAIKCVSIASAWEIAIKLSKGKDMLDIPGGLNEFYNIIDSNNLFTLPIKREHLHNLASLPPIHKDPFDKLIIATAIAENLTLLTADENIQKYDIPSIW